MKYAPLLLALASFLPTTKALGQTSPSLAQSFDDLNAAVRGKASDEALQSALSAMGFSEPDYDDDSWDMYVKIGPDCDPKKIPSASTLDPREKRCVIVDVIRNDRGPIFAALSQWGSSFHPERYGIKYEEGEGNPSLADAKNSADFMAGKFAGLKALLGRFKTDLAK